MVGANIVIGTTFSKRELKGSTRRKVPTIKRPIVGDRMGNAPIIRPDHARTNRDCQRIRAEASVVDYDLDRRWLWLWCRCSCVGACVGVALALGVGVGSGLCVGTGVGASVGIAVGLAAVN